MRVKTCNNEIKSGTPDRITAITGERERERAKERETKIKDPKICFFFATENVLYKTQPQKYEPETKLPSHLGPDQGCRESESGVGVGIT